MESTFSLGRIAGVRVGVNWSVLAIFALITFGLAAGRFPAQYPEASGFAYAIAGGTAGLVFLMSLLAHEVSHAVVAQREGVGVEGITLWLFGGIAHLEGEPRDPGADLRVAGVGPLVSLVLAGVFFAAALTLRALGWEGLTLAVFDWLAAINLALAVFNLVPAAPLDGGRILRAALWKVRGDRTSAAVTAAKAGKVFGYVLVGLGLVEMLALPGFGGLWLVLIGWFLTTAAGAEEQMARVQDALSDVRVGQLMTAEPITAPAGLTVAELLDGYVMRNRVSAFPLVDGQGRAAGLVTMGHVKKVPAERRATTPVADIACPIGDAATAHADESASELVTRLRNCADGRVLVMDGPHVVGIVTPTDIMRRLEFGDVRIRPPIEPVDAEPPVGARS